MTRSAPDPLHGHEGTSSDPRSVLDDPRARETLARYDEASVDELAELEADPMAARVLERLRVVDGWLEERLDEARDLPGSADGVCSTDVHPPIDPEDLYRYGGGPGADPLEPERRAEIAEYLAEHPDEAGWVEALASPIPAPLEVEPITPDEARIRGLRSIPGPGSGTLAASTRRAPAWLAWAPLAAAALVLAMALGGSWTGRDLAGLPESPIVRTGEAEGVLLFPRGRVLAPVPGATTYSTEPQFEVTPVEGADRYRFELRKDASGAFEAGLVVWSSTTTNHVALGSALEEGTYAWAAWAEIDGLERPLGSRPFSVVTPPQGDIMRSAAGVGADGGSVEDDVRRLHAAGYLTDARFRARSLPPGKERLEYLTGRR